MEKTDVIDFDKEAINTRAELSREIISSINFLSTILYAMFTVDL